MARILIVEDQDLVRRSMRLWLEQAGHDVEEAADGALGLRLLARTSVDLVVTDIFMPNVEGLQLVRYIRREHPHLKIVAVSGGSTVNGVSMLDAARKLGADEAVPKPFTPRDLNNAVFRCLARDSAAVVNSL
jgi:CheY-like chemotaxis protein